MTRPSPARRALTQRSAITNGKRLLEGVDGCSAKARRYRDLVEGLVEEFGPAVSPGELSQIRNAATLQLLAEDLTARLVRGEEVDAEAITRAANMATRAIASLRSRKQHRKAKPPSGSAVAAYLAEKRAAPADEVAA